MINILKFEKNISVNDVLIQNQSTPINSDEFKQMSEYFESLKRVGFLDLITNGQYYDKSKYDFYFIIGDASKNWYRKLIVKSTILDLIVKRQLIKFVVLKYYGYN